MMRKAVLNLIFILTVFSANAQATGKITYEQYINKYKSLAIKEMKRTGIPASITMAQALLESGAGNSTLAKKSNNHFGIKCHSKWKGKKVYYDDDRRHECFRKYKAVYDSYIDHSNFLTGKSRYANLFTYKTTDYKSWAHGLKKAGYATDPRYAHRLIKIIEDYKLYQLDSKMSQKDIEKYQEKVSQEKVDDFVIETETHHEVKLNNKTKYIDVKPGDTFEGIADEFGLMNWEIYRYNDIPENSNISDFRHLYIEAKRNKAHRGNDYHVVKQGETLRGISHKYGLKLKRLLKYNRLPKGTKRVKPGTKLNLRKKKK